MPQGNIYGAGAASIFDLFGDYIEGGADRAVLAVSSARLTDAAITALEKTFDSFGYGKDACSYATLLPIDGSVEGGDIQLDPHALFALIEGLDPLCLVCADEAVCTLVARAYKTDLQPDAPARLLGRPAVMFKNLDAMMESDAGKQRAWKILKSLPRR